MNRDHLSSTPDELEVQVAPSVMLSVLIIVWGEADNLDPLLDSLNRALTEIGESHEILVASGPAESRQLETVEERGLTLVEASRRRYGEILRVGLAAAKGSFVLTMDGDLSHRPGYITTMWDHRDSGEMLIASRYVRGSFAEMPWTRRMLSYLLNFLYRRTLSLPYRDLSSGLRMYRREVLEDIGLPGARGLDALPEMLTKAVCQGWHVVEVPFWYQGARPWTRARMIRLGIGFLRTLGKLFGLRNSVRAADYDSRAFDSWIPLQRYWQRRRFRIVRGFVGDARRVLDVGCGTSRIVYTLPNVVGFDISIAKLRWIRAPGRLLVQGSLSNMPFTDESFDALICSEVIEHIPREQVHLDQFIRVVRPGGILVIGTPDYARLRWRVLEWLYDRLIPGGYTSEHVNPYTQTELRHELENLGLDVIDCLYVGGGEMIFKIRVPFEARSTATPSQHPH
jgi:ubiquinone/menaquinone biosynthesis C-methylase UbiE